MIAYLVGATYDIGVSLARQKGWERVARSRFVTPAKDDIRLIWRFSELIPSTTKTPMIKSADYESGPENEAQLEGWISEKTKFDGFVSEGHGEWIEL